MFSKISPNEVSGSRSKIEVNHSVSISNKLRRKLLLPAMPLNRLRSCNVTFGNLAKTSSATAGSKGNGAALNWFCKVIPKRCAASCLHVKSFTQSDINK